MNIYSFDLADEKSCFILERSENLEILTEKIGHGKYERLPENLMGLSPSEKFDKSLELYDFPWIYSDGLLCTKNAYSLISEIIKNCGFWNKMTYKEEALYYFSTTICLDALDQVKSKVIEDDGMIFGVDKYVFKNLDYSKYPIFRLSLIPTDYPLVTEEFVGFVNKHDLKGLKFTLKGTVK
ncbi:hypothetical protein [Pleionea sediminis]|uniref:hypothetical protein n=1 Tax=Pleionea sediminis TaxID=2569479 RepID=UPI00118607F0|nr:hypothetical protein [Pleionea sediminis]